MVNALLVVRGRKKQPAALRLEPLQEIFGAIIDAGSFIAFEVALQRRHVTLCSPIDRIAPKQALNGHADAVVTEEGWILGCP